MRTCRWRACGADRGRKSKPSNDPGAKSLTIRKGRARAPRSDRIRELYCAILPCLWLALAPSRCLTLVRARHRQAVHDDEVQVKVKRMDLPWGINSPKRVTCATRRWKLLSEVRRPRCDLILISRGLASFFLFSFFLWEGEESARRRRRGARGAERPRGLEPCRGPRCARRAAGEGAGACAVWWTMTKKKKKAGAPRAHGTRARAGSERAPCARELRGTGADRGGRRGGEEPQRSRARARGTEPFARAAPPPLPRRRRTRSRQRAPLPRQPPALAPNGRG